MSDLFVITGGGTGAKIAEALVHICAAGLGPARAFVLLIDTDAANGNVDRALRTIKAYRTMQQWPWEIRVGNEHLRLFATQLSVFRITEPISTVSKKGLVNLLPTEHARSEELKQVLALLYDEDEQNADCEIGFQARPNLGCLLLAGHLNEWLPRGADGFLSAMKQATAEPSRISVMVAASIFGGTGASLLPIIRPCVEGALTKRGVTNFSQFAWSAIKMLPYYRPKDRIKSVDPSRYELDTALALRFYHRAYEGIEQEKRYQSITLLGSDNPTRNTVSPALGQSAQTNPPFFEEFLAALLLLKQSHPPRDPSKPVHLFAPTSQVLNWNMLPEFDPLNGQGGRVTPEVMRRRFGYLLHAAAFYMRVGSTAQTLSQGLAALLRNATNRQLRRESWYDPILDTWARNVSDVYRNKAGGLFGHDEKVEVLKKSDGMGNQSVEAMAAGAAAYFGRLLLWTNAAWKSNAVGLLRDVGGESPEDYAGYYQVMSTFRNAEAIRPLNGEADNALLRVVRAGIAAMMYASEHSRPVDPSIPLMPLFPEGQISLAVTMNDVRKTLAEYQNSNEISDSNEILEAYTGTKV